MASEILSNFQIISLRGILCYLTFSTARRANEARFLTFEILQTTIENWQEEYEKDPTAVIKIAIKYHKTSNSGQTAFYFGNV